MEEAMESAMSVLTDPAMLGLEAALFTAWAVAELRLQKRANQAKEYVWRAGHDYIYFMRMHVY